MQAFAKEVAEKMENSATPSKEPLDAMGAHTSLFSADEIMFPDENIERPYTRYGYKISNNREIDIYRRIPWYSSARPL